MPQLPNIINEAEKASEVLEPIIKWKPCRNCKNTEFFYYQLQPRSADEPMTTFYICKNCNKTARVNN